MPNQRYIFYLRNYSGIKCIAGPIGVDNVNFMFVLPNLNNFQNAFIFNIRSIIYYFWKFHYADINTLIL